MSTFQIKQHDLEPPLVVTVTDPAATFDQVVSWKVILRVGSDTFTDSAPTVVVSDDKHTATVTHNWVTGETANATNQGRVEVEATWPGGRPQTFPPSGYKSFTINPDLG